MHERVCKFVRPNQKIPINNLNFLSNLFPTCAQQQSVCVAALCFSAPTKLIED